MLINATVLFQFGKKFELDFIFTCLLDLFAAEYLRETNISFFFNSFMVICSLDVLKNSSKKKETRIKKEIGEVLQQASCSKKRTGKLKI